METLTKLTLNDGTELLNSYVISSRDLFVYINGNDMRTVFDLLIDPEKTKKITYTDVTGAETVYRGFKKLMTVSDEGNGLITAVLIK